MLWRWEHYVTVLKRSEICDRCGVAFFARESLSYFLLFAQYCLETGNDITALRPVLIMFQSPRTQNHFFIRAGEEPAVAKLLSYLFFCGVLAKSALRLLKTPDVVHHFLNRPTREFSLIRP